MTGPATPRPRLALTLVAVVATFAATAASAATGPVVAESMTFNSARVSSPLRALVSGNITCTKGAHFHLYIWVLDRADGALAKGKLPPKVRRGSAAEARFKAVTRCTGAAQQWSVPVLVSTTGKKPTPKLVASEGEACAIATIKKSGAYDDLKPFCGSVTIS